MEIKGNNLSENVETWTDPFWWNDKKPTVGFTQEIE